MSQNTSEVILQDIEFTSYSNTSNNVTIVEDAVVYNLKADNLNVNNENFASVKNTVQEIKQDVNVKSTKTNLQGNIQAGGKVNIRGANVKIGGTIKSNNIVINGDNVVINGNLDSSSDIVIGSSSTGNVQIGESTIKSEAGAINVQSQSLSIEDSTLEAKEVQLEAPNKTFNNTTLTEKK